MAYLELAHLKDLFKLSDNYDADDAALTANASSAIEAVSAYTGGREFIPADEIVETTRKFDTRGRFTDPFIADFIDFSLVETSSDNVNWTERAGCWGTPIEAPDNNEPFTGLESFAPFERFLRVTGRFGYGSVPSKVFDATLIYAAALFKRRDTPTGVEFGGEFGALRISRYTDPTVAQLLDPLVRTDKLTNG